MGGLGLPPKLKKLINKLLIGFSDGKAKTVIRMIVMNCSGSDFDIQYIYIYADHLIIIFLINRSKGAVLASCSVYFAATPSLYDEKTIFH